MHPCSLLLLTSARGVCQACLQEQNSFNNDAAWLLHAADHRGWCTHGAQGSGSGRGQRGERASLPHRAVWAVLRPHDRAGPRAMPEATTVDQLLVVGGTSVVGGRTAAVTHGGDHWVGLLDPLPYIDVPKLAYVTDACNGRCVLQIIS